MATTLPTPDLKASGASPLATLRGSERLRRRADALLRCVGVALALASADAMAAAIAVTGGLLVTRQSIFADVAGISDVLLLPTLACAIFALSGLYGGYGPSPAERLRLRTYGVLALALTALIFRSGHGLTTGSVTSVTVTTLLLVTLGFYAEVAVRGFLIRKGVWGARTVIVGTDPCATGLATTLLAQPELGFNPIGFLVDPSERTSAAQTGQARAILPILGAIEEARERPSVEVAVFCSSADFAASDLAQAGPLPFPRVVVAQQSQDLQSLWTQTRMLGSSLGLEIRRDLYRPRNLGFKRLADLVLTWPLILLIAPVVAVLALLIKWTDPGPAFYVQQRVGRDGKPIGVLKLRSMYVDAQQRLTDHLAADPQAQSEWLRFFKLRHDPRILPWIGGFIRRTSLDELPQFWNVLRGDLSLVGPRPFPSYHTDGFDSRFQALRRSVPPGLTGLWQVSSRSDGDLAVQQSQDTFYIRNWSIWLDFYILLATVPAILGGSGAR